MRISLEDLTQEAESGVGIGSAWLAIVEQAVSTKIRKMPPRDFGFQEWNQDAIEDIVQEVVEKRLLSKGGIEYVLAEATSTPHAQAAIYRLVALGLADLREPSVVNNIFDNLNRRMLDRGHSLQELPKSGQTETPINEIALESKVKQILLSQPRYPNRGTQRESAIFSPASFDQIVDQLLEHVMPLTSQILRNGLKKALTHLVRAENYIDDAHDFSDTQPGIEDVEQEATNQDYEFGAQILKELSQESEKVFVAIAYGVRSDAELAAALGLKARQTAKKWHDQMKLELIELFDKIEVPAESQMGVVLAMKDLLGVGDTSQKTIGTDNV
jgi:hypothetical protein